MIKKHLDSAGFNVLYDRICEVAFNTDLSIEAKLDWILIKLCQMNASLKGKNITVEEAIEKVKENA